MGIASILVVALLAALVLTPLVRVLATVLGVVDHADGKRKLHAAPVPLWGGLAVFLAWISTLLAVGNLSLDAAFSDGWLIACAVICLVGCCDDAWRLAPRWKFLGQTLAALPIVWFHGSHGAVDCAGWEIELGWWTAPLVLMWLLSCTNAMNFLDGVDGLASSCGLVAAAFLATAAEGRGNADTLAATLALCGALAGFLVFNVAPARIFLGDAGSMLLGLALGFFALRTFRNATGAVDVGPLLLLLAVPLLDLVLAVLRRSLRGQPFWQADCFHIHHCLRERGASANETTAMLAGLGVLGGFSAVAMAATGLYWPFLVGAPALLAMLVRWQLVGRHEWALLQQHLARGLMTAATRLGENRLSQALPAQTELALETDDVLLERLWRTISSAAVASVDVQVGEGMRVDWRGAQSGPHGASATWQCRLDFAGSSGGWCRMTLHLTEQASKHPWDVLETLAALHHFGRHWAASAERTVVPFSTERRAA